jgi:hypothetical protein
MHSVTSGPDVGGQVLGAGRQAVAAASSQRAPTAPTQLMTRQQNSFRTYRLNEYRVYSWRPWAFIIILYA